MATTPKRRNSGRSNVPFKVLVAVDGSPRSQRAVRKAVMLARGLGSGLLGVHVITPLQMYTLRGTESPGELGAADMRRVELREAHRYLAAVEKAAKARGVRCRCTAVRHTSAAKGIVDFARRERCGLIVVSSHGRTGLQRMLLGSVTQKVLALSRLPVLVCR